MALPSLDDLTAEERQAIDELFERYPRLLGWFVELARLALEQRASSEVPPPVLRWRPIFGTRDFPWKA